MIKGIFKILFGDVATAIFCVLISVGNWFLFPYFVGVARTDAPFAVLAAIFVGIFAVAFMLSALTQSAMLIIKGALNKTKWIKWTMIVTGAILFIFNIVIIILALI